MELVFLLLPRTRACQTNCFFGRRDSLSRAAASTDNRKDRPALYAAEKAMAYDFAGRDA
jgi:hypothetical protein